MPRVNLTKNLKKKEDNKENTKLLQKQFTSPKTMLEKIDEYFNTIEEPTQSGLARFLGFTSRDSFYKYESKVQYSEVIRYARTRIGEYLEKVSLSCKNPTAAIFQLTNLRDGWIDAKKIENTSDKTPTIAVVQFLKAPSKGAINSQKTIEVQAVSE
jgi:hypothetical protein